MRALFVPVISVFCACHPAGHPRDGTERMADTLAKLNALAASQAGNYEFLNRERVASLEQSVVQQGGPGDLQDRFGLARQQLLAGGTRDAIAGLEAIRRTTGIMPDSAQPDKKPFFDLLGIAYLRLGEQENCNLDPSTSVCILGELHHTQQRGARTAIQVYTRILQSFPQDVGSRWLLNIAYMAVGEYPAGVPKQYLIPNLSRAARPNFPLFTNIAPSVGASIMGLAGGLCVADFDGDGLLDLFTTAWGLNDPPHLLLADGKGGYVDRTKAAGIERIVGGPNCIHADYDNDGLEDVYIMRGGWLGDGGNFPSSLLHNLGHGRFEDVTFDAGLGELRPSHTAAWADYDLDGCLDLFVGAESGVGMGWSSHPSRLYRGDCRGHFTDVTKHAGIDVDAFVKGVAWGDVDNDGRPDLYVSIYGAPNRLYMNQGGHFQEVAARAGVQEPKYSFPTWFWDYDNDGWEDLLVVSYDQHVPQQEAVAREYLGMPLGGSGVAASAVVEHTRLYRNRHDGTFEDVSDAVGLSRKAIYGMGSNFGDLDNDGWLDFYIGTGNPEFRSLVPNRMFHNVDGRRFEEVTIDGGFGHLQKGHGTAFADLDRDGDEDVFIIMGGAYSGDVSPSVLFENPGWPERNWITLELRGTTANRSAIGARVEVVAVDSSGRKRSVFRTVSNGSSYGSSPLELHVGLGDATRVQAVRVTWPDAARSQTTYVDLATRQTWLLVQGNSARVLERPVVAFRHGQVASMGL